MPNSLCATAADSATAAGSALECAACLDILLIQKYLTGEQVEAGKSKLQRVVLTVMGLIRSLDKQLNEDTPLYEVNGVE